MASLLSIKTIFLHDLEVHNFKIFFKLNFKIQETNYNLLNKYILYKVNQYQVINIEDYRF